MVPRSHSEEEMEAKENHLRIGGGTEDPVCVLLLSVPWLKPTQCVLAQHV